MHEQLFVHYLVIAYQILLGINKIIIYWMEKSVNNYANI